MEFFPHKINHDGIIIDDYTGNITFDGIVGSSNISEIQDHLTGIKQNLMTVMDNLPENKKVDNNVDEKIKYTDKLQKQCYDMNIRISSI